MRSDQRLIGAPRPVVGGKLRDDGIGEIRVAALAAADRFQMVEDGLVAAALRIEQTVELLLDEEDRGVEGSVAIEGEMDRHRD